jgi:hypothetical protein
MLSTATFSSRTQTPRNSDTHKLVGREFRDPTQIRVGSAHRGKPAAHRGKPAPSAEANPRGAQRHARSVDGAHPTQTYAMALDSRRRIPSRAGPTCCRLIRLDQLNVIRQKSLRLFPFVDSRFDVDFRVEIHLEEGVPGTRCMA